MLLSNSPWCTSLFSFSLFLCFSLCLGQDEYILLACISQAYTADCLWILIQNSWKSISDWNSFSYPAWCDGLVCNNEGRTCCSSRHGEVAVLRRKMDSSVHILAREKVHNFCNHRGGSCHPQATIQIKRISVVRVEIVFLLTTYILHIS